MSTVNVQPSRSAADSVSYALYGSGREAEQRREVGAWRSNAVTCSSGSPESFVALAEARAAAHGRSVEVYSYTQNFSPDEFNKDNPAHVERVHELGVMLARAMHSADFIVVTHTDAGGGHLHNHIYAMNHDNITGKRLENYRSWQRGLHQLNDDLMEREGCRVLESPMKAKPDWDVSREKFAAGGFEQRLGDAVDAALRDPRSQNRDAFEAVLAEKGIKLAETNRDGFSYKMRREDGKWGRKKASRLSPEFTADGVRAVLDFHAEQAQQAQKIDAQKEQKNDEHFGRSEEVSLGAAAGTEQHAAAEIADDGPAISVGRSRRGAEESDDEIDNSPAEVGLGFGHGFGLARDPSRDPVTAAARRAEIAAHLRHVQGPQRGAGLSAAVDKIAARHGVRSGDESLGREPDSGGISKGPGEA